MVTFKDWLQEINYRITETGDYEWDCYGENVLMATHWNGSQTGYESSIIFNTDNTEVFEVEVCDYANNRAYRLINPEYRDAHDSEVAFRNETSISALDVDDAWENVSFIDLETDEDFLEKLHAIINGEEYDTRVSIPLDFNKDALFNLMSIAHEKDITLNKLVENTLKEYLDIQEWV